MTVKIITNIILIIGLGAAQISLISGLPSLAGNLNLVLVVLIFILGFLNFNFAVWWSVGIGFLLETYSFLTFGTYLFSLSLTIIIANWLLNYFFTNRSLYSFLALTGLATVIYELIFSFLGFIFSAVNSFASVMAANFWYFLLRQVCLNLLFTFLIYYIIHILGKNLKPVFLLHSVKSR